MSFLKDYIEDLDKLIECLDEELANDCSFACARAIDKVDKYSKAYCKWKQTNQQKKLLQSRMPKLSFTKFDGNLQNLPAFVKNCRMIEQFLPPEEHFRQILQCLNSTLHSKVKYFETCKNPIEATIEYFSTELGDARLLHRQMLEQLLDKLNMNHYNDELDE